MPGNHDYTAHLRHFDLQSFLFLFLLLLSLLLFLLLSLFLFLMLLLLLFLLYFFEAHSLEPFELL